MARLTRLSARDSLGAQGAQALVHDAALPLLDVIVSGEGRGWSGGRYCESEAGSRFRYTGHSERAANGSWHELRVDLDDPVTGLHAEVFYRLLTTGGAGRTGQPGGSGGGVRSLGGPGKPAGAAGAPGCAWRTGPRGRSRSSR